MPKKKTEKGHASFAHPPNKYMVAVNLQDSDSPHRVNATVKDGRVNVFGQHVDEIKTKNGEVRYNFHGFSNEFELPDNVDPNSLTLSVADNQTILIEGDKIGSRGNGKRQKGPLKIPRESRSQTNAHSEPLQEDRKDDRSTENKQSLPMSSKAEKDEDPQAIPQPHEPIQESKILPCELPNVKWTKPAPVSPPRTPCCPLCCGPV